MRVGLDVGSTTIKCVVLDDRNNLIYHTYERHYSHIVEKSAELLRRVAERCGREAVFAISGSAGAATPRISLQYGCNAAHMYGISSCSGHPTPRI